MSAALTQAKKIVHTYALLFLETVSEFINQLVHRIKCNKHRILVEKKYTPTFRQKKRTSNQHKFSVGT